MTATEVEEATGCDPRWFDHAVELTTRFPGSVICVSSPAGREPGFKAWWAQTLSDKVFWCDRPSDQEVVLDREVVQRHAGARSRSEQTRLGMFLRQVLPEGYPRCVRRYQAGKPSYLVAAYVLPPWMVVATSFGTAGTREVTRFGDLAVWWTGILRDREFWRGYPADVEVVVDRKTLQCNAGVCGRAAQTQLGIFLKRALPGSYPRHQRSQETGDRFYVLPSWSAMQVANLVNLNTAIPTSRQP